MIQAMQITKTIAGKKVLNTVSLSLNKGEIISIVGPSGAGKTTFLRSISLIDFPDAGSLTIDEVSYQFPVQHSQDVKLPYPHLTVVFQQLFIWPHLTIRQNVTLPLRGNIDEKHFTEMVDLFQMASFLERYPNEISVGQRQRAALVRALLCKPNYLLLDEVTSALDIEQSYIILNHVKQIARKGVGIVMVSHALHLAGKISDKVIFLDEGSIIEEGNGDILVNPKTERLKKFVNAFQQVI